jgi:hypothetical protein
MSITMSDSSTNSTTLSAPTWATDGDLGSGSTVLWSHKVELEAMEVDGPESMTVETYVYDNLTLLGGTTIRRGSTEIMVTRHDTEDPDFCGGALRFEIANARKFAATILAACDAVEGTKVTAA